MKKLLVVAGVIAAFWLAVIGAGYAIIYSVNVLLESDD
jgi:hypothetical protein